MCFSRSRYYRSHPRWTSTCRSDRQETIPPSPAPRLGRATDTARFPPSSRSATDLATSKLGCAKSTICVLRGRLLVSLNKFPVPTPQQGTALPDTALFFPCSDFEEIRTFSEQNV